MTPTYIKVRKKVIRMSLRYLNLKQRKIHVNHWRESGEVEILSEASHIVTLQLHSEYTCRLSIKCKVI
jgi:hypothetical protein